jgi:hypothetical protein
MGTPRTRRIASAGPIKPRTHTGPIPPLLRAPAPLLTRTDAHPYTASGFARPPQGAGRDRSDEAAQESPEISPAQTVVVAPFSGRSTTSLADSNSKRVEDHVDRTSSVTLRLLRSHRSPFRSDNHFQTD